MLLSQSMLLTKIVVTTSERVLHYKDGEFVELLQPGTRWFFGGAKTHTFVAVPLTAPWIVTPDKDLLAKDARLEAHADVHRIADNERGLLFRDGRLWEVLKPGVHLYLKSPLRFEVQIVDIAKDLVVPRELKARMGNVSNPDQHVRTFEVPNGCTGLEYIDKVLQERTLGPGIYSYWIGQKDVRVETIDQREQTYEVSGQELMTFDKVSIRLNLSVRYQVVSAKQLVNNQASYAAAMHRDLQLALRSEVAALTLEQLLEKKEGLGASIIAQVGALTEAYGIKVLSAGVRDVILPGEMRTIFNQVIEAEKRAQANLIARREETAATRNLLNTAKLLESNPVLLRLKELEATERIAEKIANLSIYGGVDGLIDLLRPKEKTASS